MIEILRLFFSAERTRPWLVLLCLTIASALEAIGVSSILPVANKLLASSTEREGVIERLTSGMLGVFGLQPTLGNLLLLICIAMITRALVLFGTMSYAGITAARVVTVLRRNLIQAIFDAKWSYYSDQRSGALASAISGDAARAGEAYTSAATSTSLALQVFVYSAVGLILNWRAALLGLTVAILIGGGSRWLIMMSRFAGVRLVHRTAGVTDDMVDLLRNVKPLKAMDSYDPAIKEITRKLSKLKRSIIRLALSRHGLSYSTDAVLIVFICSAVYGAHLYAGLSLPELALLGIVFFQVVNCSAKLQKSLQLSSTYVGSYAHVQVLTAEAREAAEAKGGDKLAKLDGSILFSSVSFAHADNHVLQNVSLEIPRNRITVITGPSGSGKTTIVDLLTGLYQPLTGEIWVSGVNISDFDLKSWRKKIGYVSQELVLFHDSVRSNLVLGNDTIKDEDIVLALKQANAWDFVNSLPQGLDTDVGEAGGRLSGGQRQRIALARALIGKPELLILDEVTSALDPDSESEIIRNIAGLGRQYTIVCITHRPGWKDIADRLYYVNDGRVTEAQSQSVTR